MSQVEQRLAELDITLPPAKTPVANYLGVKQHGDMLFVSARVSQLRGEVGSDIKLEDAKDAARDTIISLLAIIKDGIGDLDAIASVDKLLGFVRSASDFTQQPLVIDGASDLLVDVFGEAGRHARTATGVAQLPFGAAVQIEMVLGMNAGQSA